MQSFCAPRKNESGEPVVTLRASIAGQRRIPGPWSWHRSTQAASPNGEHSQKISTCVQQLERLRPREGQDWSRLTPRVPEVSSWGEEPRVQASSKPALCSGCFAELKAISLVLGFPSFSLFLLLHQVQRLCHST